MPTKNSGFLLLFPKYFVILSTKQMMRVMRYLNNLCWLIWALFVPVSCSSTIADEWEDVENLKKLDRNVRVLVLGNSYSVDGTAYLDHLLRNASLNIYQIAVYNGVINGGGLQEWLDVYRSNRGVSLDRAAGRCYMKSEGRLSEILRQEWDVVVVMQSSDKSYDWQTFEGRIGQMVEMVRSECSNPAVRLFYAIPWGHTATTTPRELEGNIACARRLKEEYGFEMIPVGIAVQNARNTRLCNEAYLTRDNWHLCHGVGRYVAACTWYEALLAAPSHVSVVGNPAVVELSGSERSNDTSIPVDASNRLLCQQCAYLAVRDTFAVATVIP